MHETRSGTRRAPFAAYLLYGAPTDVGPPPASVPRRAEATGPDGRVRLHRLETVTMPPQAERSRRYDLRAARAQELVCDPATDSFSTGPLLATGRPTSQPGARQLNRR